MLILLIVGN